LFSADFIGQATHKNELTGKQQAITDLQQGLFVNVESFSESFQTNKGDDKFSFTSKLSSTLPILGSTTSCYEALEYYQCTAKLNSIKSTPLYLSTIEQKQLTIDSIWQQIPNISSAELKYDELAKVLVLVQETQQLLLVVNLLTPNVDVKLTNLSSTEIIDSMKLLEKEAKGISMTARLISHKIRQKNKILIKPFIPENSSNITPFSSALQTELTKVLPAVLNKKDAVYILQGRYIISINHLQVETQLVDKQGNIIDANVINVNKTSIKEFDFTPKDSNFEKMLYSGQIIGNELKVQISSNKGERDLLFRNTETVQLLVKVNKPSYFYIVGHTNNEVGKFSYLLDLNDAHGDEKFIQYLGFEEVNKMVVIGEFEVKKPFGKESLQVFASTAKPLDILPHQKFDGDYYRLAVKQEEAIIQTRGLVRKKKNDNVNVVTEISEAVLSLTTYQ